MSPDDRFRRRTDVPSFRGEVQASPDEERAGTPTALAMAIAEAAALAAQHLTDHAEQVTLDENGEMEFEVSRIQVKVKPNPGPTSYKVTITPSG